MTMKPKFCEFCGSSWVDMEGCTNKFCPMPADMKTGYIPNIMVDSDPLIEFNKSLQRILNGEFDEHLNRLEEELKNKSKGN